MKTSNSQIIITGVYRTGSEYLTHLLDCHPELHASMYRVNVLRFMYKRFDPICLPNNQYLALKEMRQRIKKRYKIQLDINNILEQTRNIKGLNYGHIYDLIMTELYLDKNVINWAEKVQLLWREIPVFLGMMPNGRAIHIIRDPRAVFASFKRYTVHPYPASIGAVFNCYDSMRTSICHEQSFSKYVLTVRYEDLVYSPCKVVNNIWKFLGLSTGHSLDIAGKTDAYGNEWYNNSSFHKNTASDDFNIQQALHGWRNVLTNDEISLTEHICGSLMDYYGYKLSGTSINFKEIKSLVNQDKKIICYYNKWKKFRIGIEEFPADPHDEKTWEKG